MSRAPVRNRVAMGDRDHRQDNRPHVQPRQHFMDVANIRVREAFQRLRQFAVAVGNEHGLVEGPGGMLLPEEQLQLPPAGPPVVVGPAVVGRPPQPNPRNEVDIQLRVVRGEDIDNPVPVPTRTPKVPKTVLISGAVPIGTFCEVIISKVISPSMFWIKPVGSVEELRILERQMAVFYEDEHSPFRDPSFFIEEGAYSGGYYAFYSRSQRCWVRAICGYDGVLVTKNTSVSMYLLDHGKIEHVSSCSIRPLQSSFCKLPAQGLMASFVGESHESGPNRWTPETCLAFRGQLQGRKLQVAVIRKCSIDFPSRFSRAEVVLKESSHSSSVITAWNPTQGRFVKTPQSAFAVPAR